MHNFTKEEIISNIIASVGIVVGVVALVFSIMGVYDLYSDEKNGIING